MNWSSRFETGVPQIDKQHRTIFRAADMLRSALDEGEGEQAYESYLGFFHAYAESHFAAEEECMRKTRCPAAAENIIAHDRFIERLRGHESTFRLRGFVLEDAYDLATFVEHWLADHICRLDIQLKGLEEF